MNANAPIIAAIYARKSTDDSDRVAENTSVHRQIEHAKQFAEANGWTVPDHHVFFDEKTSGAEFKNRLGLQNLVAERKNYKILIVSELSRIGREVDGTLDVMSKLKRANVSVYSYLTGQEEKNISNMDGLTMHFKAIIAEEERLNASKRTRDAMTVRARLGAVTGGKVYGYKNIQVCDKSQHGSSVHAYTEHQINPEEAAVIRGIFAMYQAGHGYRAIAHTLNGHDSRNYLEYLDRFFAGSKPLAPRGNLWAATGIREMLRNERYIGQIIYGKFKNTYEDGRAKIRTPQDKKDWIITECPELRIVESHLWDAVQNRLSAKSKTYEKQIEALTDKARHSHHLLSGLMICEECGCPMIAIRCSYGSGSTRRLESCYMCSGYKKHGTVKCSNSLRKPTKLFEEQIIQVIKREFLSDSAISTLTAEVANLLKDDNEPLQRKLQNLQAELKKLEREIDNLWAIAAAGSDNTPATLGREIKKREERQQHLAGQINELSSRKPLESQDIEQLINQVQLSLLNLEALLQEGGDQSRQVLKEFFDGQPIRCRSRKENGKKSYQLFLPHSYWNIISAVTIPWMASPRGFEPRLSP
ncbi:MAG: hypothetical protein H6R07_3080 [Proteobacteria bacterium]|nr:hypothetical protein [Pseudomonadota bacterium]